MSVSPRLRLLRIVGRLETLEIGLRALAPDDPTRARLFTVRATLREAIEDLKSLMGELE